ncbi:hypothetical protein POM88_020980 [Heracleum sosnowskyi]|uniref:Uncharacterized protein n=1 Tax=Heracleum sosnowskyi TaxID=360622 RepID=A0AAD8IG13_9APIA|nr:hypothetical protein POM88_020980 [Heracleum sosnowskyi]
MSLQSVDNEIVLWEPIMKDQSPGEGSVDILQKYSVPECDIWFIKFSCDFHYNVAAIGKYCKSFNDMPVYRDLHVSSAYGQSPGMHVLPSAKYGGSLTESGIHNFNA